jgi:hypothetical protein
MFLCIICCGSEDRAEQDRISDEFLSIERWPGEGLPIIAWTGAETMMHVYASASDSVASDSIVVIHNENLEWDKSLIIIRKPGQMKISNDCIIDGFVYKSLEKGKFTGGRARQLNFSSGTILEVICYAAEGYYIFRLGDEYIEMESSHECQELLTLPETEWWVRICKDSKPLGWIRADQEDITVVDRRF